MKRALLPSSWLALAGAVVVVSACGPSEADDATGGNGGSGHPTGTATGNQGGATTISSTMAAFMTNSTATGMTTCDALPTQDKDGDGFTIMDGDCNDCDPNVNPNALEVVITDPDPMTMMIPTPADEDCDGTIDNPPPPTCDVGLALDSTNAMDAAKAIELCKTSTGVKSWGVVTADFVRANGNPIGTQNPAQHGLLPNYGPNVPTRAGDALLGLSSGRARLPGQPDAATGRNMSSQPGSAPTYFPQDVPGCPGGTAINDDIALQVDLRAPMNATGYKFNFKFYTFEYAQWICTKFNDQFIALVDPAPMGSVNGNISFDSQNNPVSVNIAFFDVCSNCTNFASQCKLLVPMPSCPNAPMPCCPSGAGELMGTGFDNSFGTPGGEGGGTTWLETTAPIKGGDEFLIRFSIWDTGDHNLDSTALIDNFRWIASGGTVIVGTTPVPS
jgi:hypothetical protein